MAWNKESNMFDKKWEKFTNGKTFYMIDRSTFEIRKTKIYGYQFDKNKNFYVYAKIHYMNFGFTKGLSNQGIKKSWEFSKPNCFHKNVKDAILFAKAEKKNRIQERILDLEKQIEKRQKEVKEKQQKIESLTNEDIVIKEGVFDNFSPNSSRGYI
jgi:hypothetical protein|tara:strand:- start:79 stop:543 length:465 start_codon:yes stop_codon:yes gene_type:complete